MSSSDSRPMRGVRVSDEEAARRMAMVEAHYAQNPPLLYRLSSMDPDSLLHGSFGESHGGGTRFIFTREDAGSRPRLEVHTFQPGSSVEPDILWLVSFGSPASGHSGAGEPLPVFVSGEPASGQLLAATDDGWMVSIAAPDAELLVIGPGARPDPLSLERVDIAALLRSELRPLR